MIDITNHAYERYCERVLGMALAEIKPYLTQQRKDILKVSISDMFDRSRWVYTGKYMENTFSAFYLFDDILLVCKPETNTLITMYPVEFGFSRNTNKKVIDDLMDEILELQEEYTREEPFVAEETGNIERNILLCETKIQSLTAQLKMIEDQKRSYEFQKGIVGNPLRVLTEKIHVVASKICYSVNYKADSFMKK